MVSTTVSFEALGVAFDFLNFFVGVVYKGDCQFFMDTALATFEAFQEPQYCPSSHSEFTIHPGV